jgi:spore maturation protein CgeB
MDPVALVAEASAHEKRLAYIGTLGKYQAKVWGDSGWRELEAAGIRYMGYAGHKHELNKVYCGSKINVDVNLAHPDERLRIAKRGMEAVRARHSIRRRVESMVRVADGACRIQ